MVTRLSIHNFRSIKDITIDFTYGEGRAPSGYRDALRIPFIEDGGSRAVPCLALFGANAAGKSNIITAARTFMDIINVKKRDVRTVYDPNQIVTGMTFTKFSMEVANDGHLYEYVLKYSGDGIKEELLFVDGKELYSITDGVTNFGKIGTDEYRGGRISDVYNVECRAVDGTFIYPILPVLGNDFAGVNESLTNAYDALKNGVTVAVHKYVEYDLREAVDMLAKVTKTSVEEAFAEVVSVIRVLDVGIISMKMTEHEGEPFDTNIDLIRQELPEGKMFGVKIISEHQNDRGEHVFFRFLQNESEGTQRLAVVIAFLLYAVRTGSMIMFDELDRGLHPILAREVLNLFTKRAHNRLGAQICFTTHCTDFMEDCVLRVSEVGIVSKNDSDGTQIRRITDFRKEGADIRNVTNFRDRYLDGYFSGIPSPGL